MKVMNVAVVGAGIYGINHVNAYTWNPNTNLVAVCDLNKEITDRIAEEYKLPFLERFAKELKETQESGEINFSKLKDEWLQKMAARIMDDYQMFYYEDTIYRLEQELNDAKNRLERLKTSNEMKVGRTTADKIRKKLGKA